MDGSQDHLLAFLCGVSTQTHASKYVFSLTNPKHMHARLITGNSKSTLGVSENVKSCLFGLSLNAFCPRCTRPLTVTAEDKDQLPCDPERKSRKSKWMNGSGQYAELSVNCSSLMLQAKSLKVISEIGADRK